MLCLPATVINRAIGLQHYDLVPPVTTFALPAAGTNNQTVGIRTGAGEYVLKRSTVPHAPAGLRYEHDLLLWLQGRGLSFSVPAPVATAAGATYVRDGAGFCTLLPLLAGSRPDRGNPAHLQAVGAALGELHCTLHAYPASARPGMPSFGDLRAIHPLVPDPGALTPAHLGWSSSPPLEELCSWWRAEYQSTSRFIRDTYSRLPRQVIHGDFAPSNTLWHEDRISAILDFEFSCADLRILDVASGLKYSMRVWEQEDPWTVGAHFCRGYARFVTLADREMAALVPVTILRDTVSVIWHYGRSLAGGRRPDHQRLHDARDSASWLSAHRSQIEALPGAASEK